MVVVSDRAGAAGLARARAAGIDARWVSREEYPSRDGYDRALVDILIKAKGHIKSKIW